MLAEFLGLGPRNASLENPALDLHDPATWEQVLGGIDTDAGITLTHAGALAYGPVWQAVSLISGDVAKLPLDVFVRQGEDRSADREHPAFRLVRRQTNREQSAFQFWRTLMSQALLWGNGFAYIDHNGAGKPIELLPLLPDRTVARRISGRLYYVTEIGDGAGARLKTLNADQVLHIRGLSLDGMVGVDLVGRARESFALGLAAQKFGARFFKNGARASGVLMIPPGLTEQAQKNLTKSFEAKQEGLDNAAKTIVLRDGAKWQQNTIAQDEAQFTETRLHELLAVAAYYNLPPHKLGHPSRTSYNSLEQENRSYLDTCLSHWLVTISAECWLKLLSREEKENDTHYFEHNTGALIAADLKTVMEVGEIGIRSSVMTPDEVRRRLNMNARSDGLGGRYHRQANIVIDSDKIEEPEPEPEPGPTVEPPTEENRRQVATKAVFIAGQSAIRKARKPDAFIEWLEANLKHERAAITGPVANSIFDAMVERLNFVAATATAETLKDDVTELVRRCELNPMELLK